MAYDRIDQATRVTKTILFVLQYHNLTFLLFWRTKSGFSMAAVRAKCTANVAEPDLRLSCTVTVPMCAKPIAGSAGSFGVHFAFTVDVQTKLKPFYSGKKVQSKPTEVP